MKSFVTVTIFSCIAAFSRVLTSSLCRKERTVSVSILLITEKAIDFGAQAATRTVGRTRTGEPMVLRGRPVVVWISRLVYGK